MKNIHFNDKYWREVKINLPPLSPEQIDILIGTCLGDASIIKRKLGTSIKFEQGYIHKLYLLHLFEVFKPYCYVNNPQLRQNSDSSIKSLYFRTWSQPIFNFQVDLFIIEGKKSIKPSLILNNLTPRGQAYWIMDDGSLNGNTMILHTQSYTKQECEIISSELNEKFNLNTIVIPHKEVYYVVKIPFNDAKSQKNLIEPYIIQSFVYKLPK